MAGIADLASEVASKGRKGDSTLVHMAPGEVKILEYISGAPLSENPQTGMPEAFSLWKLLAGIGAIAAAIPTGGASLPLFGGLGLSSGVATALGTAAGAIGAGLVSNSLKPSDKPTSQSEAAKYIADQEAKKKAAMDNIKIGAMPIYVNPTSVSSPYQEGGREKNYFSAVNPMQQGIKPYEQQSPLGMAGGGIADLEPEEQKAKQIVAHAIIALNGDHEDAPGAINKFLKYYGPEDLSTLQQIVGPAKPMFRGGMACGGYAQGGYASGGIGRMISGPGAGMDDMVPAALGDQKVLLSDGEFVVPADVVSALGDGSSEAGGRKLHAMMDKVRQQKTGSKKQPGKINDRKVMPNG